MLKAADSSLLLLGHLDKMCQVRSFGKMIEELGAENTEGDDDKKFRVAPLYIRLCQHPDS